MYIGVGRKKTEFRVHFLFLGLVMVSANDPIESFLNSIQEVLSPLELGIRKAAKDLEHCWGGPKNKGNGSSDDSVISVNQLNSKVEIFGVKKKSNSNNSNGQCVVVCGDERKKGLSIKVPIKAFLGMFSGNGHRVEVLNRGLKEKGRDSGKADGGSCVNCLQFAVTWSLLLNSFVQSLPSPFKAGKKRFQKAGDGEKLCSCMKPKVLSEVKQRESKEQCVGTLQNERNHVSLECFMGFIFDQLAQSLQKFDQVLQEDSHNSCDDASLSPPASSNFDHLRALTTMLEGRKADVNGFLGNLRFARVGGVPSGVVGVTSSVDEEGDDGVNAGNREETGGTLPQKLASGILSIPLSNVERLRSTLSTVSLAELIELVPQLGRTSTDYPDKKKLFSVQDFFRYTEAEGMVISSSLKMNVDSNSVSHLFLWDIS